MIGMLCLCIFFLTDSARAAIQGPPISDNNYNVDLTLGPVMGSNRMLALAGAYVGIAEDTAGISANPASVLFYSKPGDPRWDPGFAFGYFRALGKDLDNNGSTLSDVKNHQVIQLGLMLQNGKYGLGALIQGQSIEFKTGDQVTEFSFLTPTLALGRAFRERQILLAVAVKPATLEVKDKESSSKLFKLEATGFEIGGLWHPQRGPFRLGMTYQGRTSQEQVISADPANPTTAAGLIVPKEVELPWRSSLGVSYRWDSILRGRKLLLTGQLTVVGKSRDAYGIESFLEQKVQRIGTRTTLSPHAGGEIDLLPKKLRARLGSYLEPSRFEGTSSRAHMTGGLEWSFWRWLLDPEDASLSLQYAFDLSRDYSNHSISLGIWRF